VYSNCAEVELLLNSNRWQQAAGEGRVAAQLAGDVGGRNAPGGVRERRGARRVAHGGKAAAVVLKVDRSRLRPLGMTWRMSRRGGGRAWRGGSVGANQITFV